MLHTKMEGKRPRGRPRTRWIYQIRKNIEIRRENWEKIQENMKWKYRDGWKSPCNSRPISLETT